MRRARVQAGLLARQLRSRRARQQQQQDMGELKRLLAQQMAERQLLTVESAQRERLTAQSARARGASIELASQERVRTAAALADANISEARLEMQSAHKYESAMRKAAENIQDIMTAEVHSDRSKETEACRRATSTEETARDKVLRYERDAEETRLAKIII